MSEVFKPVQGPGVVKYKRTVKYDWWGVAERLRGMPGRWAMIVEDGPMSAYNTLKNGTNALPPDQFEIVGRNFNREADPPTCTVYARLRSKSEQAEIKRQMREQQEDQ